MPVPIFSSSPIWSSFSAIPSISEVREVLCAVKGDMWVKGDRHLFLCQNKDACPFSSSQPEACRRIKASGSSISEGVLAGPNQNAEIKA
jgi:hypothetical protein